MEALVRRLENLLNIKNLVTLVLTAVFAVLALWEKISGDQFLTVFTVVIAFCFGTQTEKNNRQEGYRDSDAGPHQPH